jgi:hypothetical protein
MKDKDRFLARVAAADPGHPETDFTLASQLQLRRCLLSRFLLLRQPSKAQSRRRCA